MPASQAAPAASPAAKSCDTCPSRLLNSQQANFTGRSIGGPVCGLKLIPLSRAGGPTDKTYKHFAAGCADHGREVQPNPEAIRQPLLMTVGFPAPVRPPAGENGDPSVNSCARCINFVPTMAVRRATGWATGYCKAKGSLLLDDRLDTYAATCTEKDRATVSERVKDTDIVTLPLFPEYSPTFGEKQKPDPFKIHAANLITSTQSYSSDVPITDKHKARGIKAIRKILDPRGKKKDLYLPIMDEDAIISRGGNKVPLFSEEDKARIPRSGDPERPESYFDHNGLVYRATVCWVYLKQTPALWGMPGTGKTEALRHMAWLMGMPFTRISITESSEVDDLIGKLMYSPERGTWFQYGRIPLGWQRPNVLCLDEPNTGPDAVWQAVRPLTDDSKQMVVDQNSGERIPQHPLCYLGMAMNPAWDPRNKGVAPLADADGSRLAHIEMELPPEAVEKKIIKEVLESDKWDPADADRDINVLMSIARELRAMSNENSVSFTWGIRSQIKVARLRAFMSWPDAFRMGVTDSLEPEVRQLIMKSVESHADDD